MQTWVFADANRRPLNAKPEQSISRKYTLWFRKFIRPLNAYEQECIISTDECAAQSVGIPAAKHVSAERGARNGFGSNTAS